MHYSTKIRTQSYKQALSHSKTCKLDNIDTDLLFLHIALCMKMCVKWPSQKGNKSRGPRAFNRSPDNQQRTVQLKRQFSLKDNQNDRIQINACVVGNESVCWCEHLVWRRISSKEKPFLYLFLPRPWSTPWKIWPKPLPEWQHSK